MISGEKLAQEYINVINNYYPRAGKLLRHCLVKILRLHTNHNHKDHYYVGFITRIELAVACWNNKIFLRIPRKIWD